MSIAKKCDRCGKFYEQYNERNNAKCPNGVMLLNIDSQQKYYSHAALDFCPDCMNDFNRWFKKMDDMNDPTP